MMTRAAGSSARNWRVAGMPPKPGIFKSIKITSGASWRANATARAPSAAWPTTSIPSA